MALITYDQTWEAAFAELRPYLKSRIDAGILDQRDIPESVHDFIKSGFPVPYATPQDLGEWAEKTDPNWAETIDAANRGDYRINNLVDTVAIRLREQRRLNEAVIRSHGSSNAL